MMQILRNEAKGTNHHISKFHTLLYSQFRAVIIIIIIIIIIRTLQQDFMNAAPKLLSLSYNVNKLLNTWNTYSEIRETA